MTCRENPDFARRTSSARVIVTMMRIGGTHATRSPARSNTPAEFSFKAVYGGLNCDRREKPSFSTQSTLSGHFRIATVTLRKPLPGADAAPAYGRLLCCRCRRYGVYHSSESMNTNRRAALRIPKLRAMLEIDKPLRLKPSTMGGNIERRRDMRPHCSVIWRFFATRISPRSQ